MTTEKNKQLVRCYYEEIVNGAKVDELPEYLSPGYVEIHNNKRYAIGIEGAKEHILGVHFSSTPACYVRGKVGRLK